MNSRNGFTFFEMVVVMAIVSTLIVVSTIGISQMQSIFRLRSAADEMRALLQLGREYSLSNKDSATYGVTQSNNIFKLLKNNAELSRYQIPKGVNVFPSDFLWDFDRLSGFLSGCSPCQITLTSLGNNEVININENGMVF